MVDLENFFLKPIPKQEDLDKQDISVVTNAAGSHLKHHHIYAIHDTTFKKIYVGKHSCNEPDFLDTKYFGSGIALRKRMEKYGKSGLKRYQLTKYDNLPDCLRAERYFVGYEEVRSSGWYNLVIGGGYAESPYRHYILASVSESPVPIDDTGIDFNDIHSTHVRINKVDEKIIWVNKKLYWKHIKYFSSLNVHSKFKVELEEKRKKARKIETCKICREQYPASMYKKHFSNSICHEDVYDSVIEAVGLPAERAAKLKLQFDNIILRETKTHIDWYLHGYFAPEGSRVFYKAGELKPIPHLETLEHEVIRQIIASRRKRRELLGLSNLVSAINIKYSGE